MGKDMRGAIRDTMICVNVIEGIYSRMAKALGVKENTLVFFYALDDGRAHSQKQICDEWFIPRSTLNTIVKECVAKGQVVLFPGDGAREKSIKLTEAGRRFAHALLERVYQAEDEAAARAGVAFSPATVAALRRFTADLHASAGRLVAPPPDEAADPNHRQPIGGPMETATARATVRPFEAGDFDQLVELYPPEWLFDGTTPAEREAQARMDCAGMVSGCNERLVAVVADDGGSEHVAGLLFARIEGLPAPDDAQTWEAVAREARGALAQGGPDARRALAYIEQLGERGDLLAEAAGESRGPDNELELFVVGPRARGKGAGGALMAAFEGHLAERGAHSYWLQTDTSCTWQWYERHGYVRVADVALDRAFSMPAALCPAPGEGAGQEQGREPAAHVFMYRKDLE